MTGYDAHHGENVAWGLNQRLRRYDASAAHFWDAEQKPAMLEHLAQTLARDAARPARPLEIDQERTKLIFDGETFTKRPADDDRFCVPQKYAGKNEQIRATQAERTLTGLVRAESGQPAGEKFTRQQRERATLLEQSHALAQSLEAAGVPAYRHDDTALWIYWVCSGEWQELAKFRRICFLPAVAAQVRSAKLAALEFFIQKNPFCRFWTFTSGPRVALPQLRARIEWLHRKLNALNKFLRLNYSVELVFRSTELGTLEFDDLGNARGEQNAGRIETDQEGNPLFHPHAHCVVQSLRGPVPKGEWQKMFSAIWDFWRDDDGGQLNWDGGRRGQSGVIRNARECCKYVTKPGDLLRLTPAQLAGTQAALSGLKLVQPLGELKKEIATRRAEKKRLIRQPTPDGCVWRECFDWNKHAETTAEQREFEKNVLEAKTFASETATAARLEPGQEWPRGKDAPPWCRVFARQAPAVGPRFVKEPRVIVGGNVFDAQSVRGHPLVQKLWGEGIQGYERGLLAEAATAQALVDSISVHTVTPTGNFCQAWDPEPDPAESWETSLSA